MHPDDAIIRPARQDELLRIRDLVAGVMGQVYAHLLHGVSLVPPQTQPWADSHVAVLDDEIVGVGMTREDLVSDLWLRPQARGKSIGDRLLALLEAEILERGYARARLRVVAENTRASAFYRAHGWQEEETFQHESLDISMMNMVKSFAANSDFSAMQTGAQHGE